MPAREEAEEEHEPSSSSSRTRPLKWDGLTIDAQPLRVNVDYDSLVEHAVRRGDSTGYGVPAFVVQGCEADLVSDASLSPPTSPVLDNMLDAGACSEESIAADALRAARPMLRWILHFIFSVLRV
ncbi:hypothetical protein PENSPDRAFT_693927 [Peniophora sp. CONT]|nr:hypothetical protein PENSPDRAFT_693927 [Peniophora sp. CONT]